MRATRPSLTAKRLQGLNDLASLAEADIQADYARWPADHPIHAALIYVRELREWHSDRKSKS
jgi:hypothetical protein